jgi:hypothetical protein
MRQSVADRRSGGMIVQGNVFTSESMMIALKSVSSRHPRESGGPAPFSDATRRSWIPAFAGMTMSGRSKHILPKKTTTRDGPG